MLKSSCVLALLLLLGSEGCVRPLSALHRKMHPDLAWAEVLILQHASGSLNLEEAGIVAHGLFDQKGLQHISPLRGRPDKNHHLIVIRRDGTRDEFETTIWSDPIMGCFADATFSPTVWRSYIRYSADIVELRLKVSGQESKELPIRLWAVGGRTSSDFR